MIYGNIQELWEAAEKVGVPPEKLETAMNALSLIMGSVADEVARRTGTIHTGTSFDDAGLLSGFAARTRSPPRRGIC